MWRSDIWTTCSALFWAAGRICNKCARLAARNYDSAVVKRALHSKGPRRRRQFGLKEECRSSPSSGMEFSSLFNSTQRQRLQQRNVRQEEAMKKTSFLGVARGTRNVCDCRMSQGLSPQLDGSQTSNFSAVSHNLNLNV